VFAYNQAFHFFLLQQDIMPCETVGFNVLLDLFLLGFYAPAYDNTFS